MKLGDFDDVTLVDQGFYVSFANPFKLVSAMLRSKATNDGSNWD